MRRPDAVQYDGERADHEPHGGAEEGAAGAIDEGGLRAAAVETRAATD